MEPDDDENPWAPPSDRSAVPPNVETRPLGSRTRFFVQPAEQDTEPRGIGTPPVARPARAEPAPAAFPVEPRPERTRASGPSAPAPMSAPPSAPAPDRPFPTAPPPATPRASESRPGIDQIDIPLDPDFPIGADLPISDDPPAGTARPGAGNPPGGSTSPAAAQPIGDDRPAGDDRPRGDDRPIAGNPEPAPERRPEASAARADGIVAPPADPDGSPRPSALRDGIIGVAVGRAAISPDGFTTPHLDDVPTPGDQPASGGERQQLGDEQRQGSPWGDFSGRRQPDEHAGDVITGYPSARPGPAGAIHGVGITVLVTDLERSTRFYRDTLGFFEIDNGDGSAVLASGDTRLVLRTVHSLQAEAGRLIYLNLEVGDIEAVHAELRDKGVKFVHSPRPVNRGDKLELWSATFRDPDNHNIAITQWRAVS